MTIKLPPAVGTDYGYKITYEGTDYEVHRSDKGWLCSPIRPEPFKQVKEVKQAIVDFIAENGEVPVEVEPSNLLWNCVDPVALLVLRVDDGGHMLDYERVTLNNLGYIDPVSGELDIARAERELNRVIKPTEIKDDDDTNDGD